MSLLPRDQNSIVDAIFNIIPTLTNLMTLVCHNVTFTRTYLLAIHSLSQLGEVELQSCRTTCQPEDFPDFSTIPLRTLVFDYPHCVKPSTNSPFLSLFLQSRKLARISTGCTENGLYSNFSTRLSGYLGDSCWLYRIPHAHFHSRSMFRCTRHSVLHANRNDPPTITRTSTKERRSP